MIWWRFIAEDVACREAGAVVERGRLYRGDANPGCLRVTQRRPVAQEAIGIPPAAVVHSARRGPRNIAVERPKLADRIRGADVTEVTVPQQPPAYATVGD